MIVSLGALGGGGINISSPKQYVVTFLIFLGTTWNPRAGWNRDLPNGFVVPVVPGQAGGGSFQSIKKHKPIRTSKPIEKKNHALQGSDGDGQSDATRQCAAHSGARTARETKCSCC